MAPTKWQAQGTNGSPEKSRGAEGGPGCQVGYGIQISAAHTTLVVREQVQGDERRTHKLCNIESEPSEPNQINAHKLQDIRGPSEPKQMHTNPATQMASSGS